MVGNQTNYTHTSVCVLMYVCVFVSLYYGLAEFSFVVSFSSVCLRVLFHWFTNVSGEVIKVTVHFNFMLWR